MTRTSSRLHRGNVKRYRRVVRRLIENIDAAIHDLEFESHAGQIIHAVDFTEITAYVLPGSGEEKEEYLSPLIAGLQKNEQIAFELAILSAIFFGADDNSHPPVVLLPPHQYFQSNAAYIAETSSVTEELFGV